MKTGNNTEPLSEAIIEGIGHHLEELDEAGVALDWRFLSELSDALEAEALRQGLEAGLIDELKETLTTEVALSLGLETQQPEAGQGKAVQAA